MSLQPFPLLPGWCGCNENLPPRIVKPLADPLDAFARALDDPEGVPPLEIMPRSPFRCYSVPDETRPFPLKILLPALLDRLFSAFPGLAHEKVCIVVGGDLHEAPDQAQLTRILPQGLRGCPVVSHDARRSVMRRMGCTSRGTPVEINAAYADAELKIVMGMVDVHQFVGFTGGAKGVVVGCASAAAITANHRMLNEEGAFAGNIEDNPVRNDLDEAGMIAGVNLAINVALTPEREIAALFAGAPSQVMRSAAAEIRQLYGLPLNDRYDIVIASCGGAPKDICLYQAQKGLDPGHCARPGGKILLVAQCPQGIGDERYETYVTRFSSHDAVLHDFAQREFAMGAHKAFLFARAVAEHELILHTDLSDAEAARCLLNKGDAQAATLNRWLRQIPTAKVAILPYANTTFFHTKD